MPNGEWCAAADEFTGHVFSIEYHLEMQGNQGNLSRILALGAPLVALSWLLMMATHELGHILAAWITGGQVVKVVLHPLAISRTDVSPNPFPTFVIATGPIVGCIIPLFLWGAAAALKWQYASLLRFFSGFAFAANGAYLVSVVIMPAGDTQELLTLGVPMWMIALPGFVGFVSGLMLWHRQHDDIMKCRTKKAITTLWSATVVLVTILAIVSPRS